MAFVFDHGVQFIVQLVSFFLVHDVNRLIVRTEITLIASGIIDGFSLAFHTLPPLPSPSSSSYLKLQWLITSSSYDTTLVCLSPVIIF